MTLTHMTRMFLSETEGWGDLIKVHPLPRQLLWSFVVPMSLIPPVMYAYAELVQPGKVFPALVPHLAGGEVFLVGGLFIFAELVMVWLMTGFIHQRMESLVGNPSYEGAFTLASVAPTPLWLAALALFIPSLWVNMVVVAAAWVGFAMLIRHGISPLLGISDESQVRRMANTLTFAGVMAWVSLIVVLELLISFVVGWR